MQRALRDSRRRRRMIYGHVAAFVVAAAHIAVSCHFLTALHFRGRHCGIWQAGKQGRGSGEEDNKNRDSAAQLHHSIVLQAKLAEKHRRRSGNLRLSNRRLPGGTHLVKKFWSRRLSPARHPAVQQQQLSLKSWRARQPAAAYRVQIGSTQGWRTALRGPVAI